MEHNSMVLICTPKRQFTNKFRVGATVATDRTLPLYTVCLDLGPKAANR